MGINAKLLKPGKNGIAGIAAKKAEPSRTTTERMENHGDVSGFAPSLRLRKAGAMNPAGMKRDERQSLVYGRVWADAEEHVLAVSLTFR
jgi:hypothetical protein